MPFPVELSNVEKMNLKNIYCCALVQGRNAEGVPLYCYTSRGPK